MDRQQLEAWCTALPLFPLPGVVLMPGASMPLHVFEPRYRELVRDLLQSGGVLAIPQIRAGEEGQAAGTPSLYPYAGVGRIVAHQELPDGRYNIVVEPLGRVRLGDEKSTEHAYRVAEAELLEDAHPVDEDLDSIGRRVQGLFLPILGRGGDAGARMSRMLQQLSADRVPEAIAPWVLQDSDARQAYLSESDPAARATQVETALLAALAEAGVWSETGEA